MPFFTILLILFLIIILRPILKVVLLMRRYKKAVNNAYSEAYKQYSRREEQPQQPVHKKVFTKDMGEYVAFEEISVETTTELHSDDKGDVTYTTEEQITDAEWVEIQ